MGCGHSANLVKQPTPTDSIRGPELPLLQKLDRKQKRKQSESQEPKSAPSGPTAIEEERKASKNLAANPRFFYNEDYYTSLAIQQSMLEQEQNKEEVTRAFRRTSA